MTEAQKKIKKTSETGTKPQKKVWKNQPARKNSIPTRNGKNSHNVKKVDTTRRNAKENQLKRAIRGAAKNLLTLEGKSATLHLNRIKNAHRRPHHRQIALTPCWHRRYMITRKNPKGKHRLEKTQRRPKPPPY